MIIISCFLLLWFGTGFYYIADDQFGLILKYGRIAMVKHGVDVGFVLPYPFGRVEILRVNSTLINFKDSANHTKLILLTKDLQPVNIDGNFSYKIDDPKQLYRSYLQKPKNVDEIVLWNLQSSIHNVVAKLDYQNLKILKLVDLQVLLQNDINHRLAGYGLHVVKINISAVNSIPKAMIIPQDKSGVPNVDMPNNTLANKIDTDLDRDASRKVSRSRNFNREVRSSNAQNDDTAGGAQE